MLKKSITYTDFNDNEVTEDFYFHMSKADLIEMEMSHNGGYEKWLKEIVNANDGGTIISEFKKLILSAYGKKSPDGSRFVKTQELRDEFEASEAYSTLFVELITDAGVAAEFVNGVVPKGLKDDMAKLRTHPSDAAATPQPSIRSETETRNVFEQTKPETRVITQSEAADMDPDELKSGLVTGRYTIPSGPDAYRLP